MIGGDRFVQVAQVVQYGAQVSVRLGVVRPDTNGGLIGGDGLVEAAKVPQRVG
jgi:hypothetical protein